MFFLAHLTCTFSYCNYQGDVWGKKTQDDGEGRLNFFSYQSLLDIYLTFQSILQVIITKPYLETSPGDTPKIT